LKEGSPRLPDADLGGIESTEGELRADFDEHLAEPGGQWPPPAPRSPTGNADNCRAALPRRLFLGKGLDEQGIHSVHASLDVFLLSG
jgi:hypothetical protein